MPGEEHLLTLKFTVKGVEAEAQVISLTPDTVLLRIDPRAPWDTAALRCLSIALETIAKTLPLKRS
jgi:hypothetical protein